ncbi:hypothetical protein [Siccirubricoccus phaeus]|uniref:hypothetical protein n=1 Tax=Siccirubricoccus phaeus TaxID=2595053 RepID=UPI0011F2619B|nr:hypothetical protein [Siccirubricoccus phaeus]
MARIPMSPGPRVAPDGQSNIKATPDAFGAGVGTATAGVGATLIKAGDEWAQVAAKLAREDEIAARSKLQTQMVTGLSELRTQLDAETDPDKIQALWTEGQRSLQNTIRTAAGGNRRQQEWATTQLGLEIARDQQAVGRLVLGRRRERNLAELNDGLFALNQQVGTTRNMDDRARLLETGTAQIAAAVTAGCAGARWRC